MALSDPLGDMLTRIRNGQSAHKAAVSTPASKLRVNVLEVLRREGYIAAYSARGCPIWRALDRARLPQWRAGDREMRRVSKPGRRIYGVKGEPRVYSGLGIAILCTPHGVMSGGEAREAQVGGEVLCTVVEGCHAWASMPCGPGGVKVKIRGQRERAGSASCADFSPGGPRD